MLNNYKLDINKSDSFGVNAFWIAAFYGHVPIMLRLMEKGADIYSKNHNGSNVLHIAVKKNNEKVVQQLIKMKFPLNITKNNGITAAGIAAFKGFLNML
jgi:ankyrin repeat protein